MMGRFLKMLFLFLRDGAFLSERVKFLFFVGAFLGFGVWFSSDRHSGDDL